MVQIFDELVLKSSQPSLIDSPNDQAENSPNFAHKESSDHCDHQELRAKSPNFQQDTAPVESRSSSKEFQSAASSKSREASPEPQEAAAGAGTLPRPSRKEVVKVRNVQGIFFSSSNASRESFKV